MDFKEDRLAGSPTVVDLFCGAGGMSEGFRMAGYKILLGIEANAAAGETYRQNNPNTELLIEDIRHVKAEVLLEKLGGMEIDVVVGGPPCQGFSHANTRKRKNDRRNRLYLEYVRVVKILRPKFFVMENVSGFLKAVDGSRLIINNIRRLLPEYSIEGQILTASDYNVPQKRKRAFLIGRRGGGNIRFPEKCTNLSGIAVKNVLIPRKGANRNLFYSKRLIKGFKRREKRNRIRGVGFGWQFLDPEKPSYTIPARYYKDGSNALVKYSENKIRMLDTSECAGIQGFPKGYIFAGSRVDIYRQIGNAVPPPVAKRVAWTIKKLLFEEVEVKPLQIVSLVENHGR